MQWRRRECLWWDFFWVSRKYLKSALVQHTIPRISYSLTGRRSASLAPSLYRGQLMLIGHSRDGTSNNYFHSNGSDYEPLLAAFFQTFPSEVDSIGAVAVLALSLVAGDVIRLASSLPSSVIVPVEEEEEQIARMVYLV
ncbi:hypothetical protein Bca101_025421 [Brassica carinata]